MSYLGTTAMSSDLRNLKTDHHPSIIYTLISLPQVSNSLLYTALFPLSLSSRLTIRASCNMDLSDFPMDKQRCPLIIGSCKYSMHAASSSSTWLYEYLLFCIYLRVSHFWRITKREGCTSMRKRTNLVDTHYTYLGIGALCKDINYYHVLRAQLEHKTRRISRSVLTLKLRQMCFFS